ncbi:MAG: hypothetical protein JWQ74_3132 [Marmoricola sp.]|nr:hypothetical protein [Marmoricola sp.]
MHRTPRSSSLRAQAAACVLAITAGLTVVPALVSTASATPPVVADPAACTSAKAALKKAVAQRATAKKAAAKAVAAVKKAKASHKPAKAKRKAIAQARAARTKADTKYAAAKKLVTTRKKKADSDCAEIVPLAKATAAGKKLGLLAVADGLPVDSLDLAQLTALLEQLLPGVTDQLDPAQLTALLGGFNAAGDLDPAAALALLSGLFSAGDVTALLAGTASPEQLLDLAGSIVGQLAALGGGLPVPPQLDLAGLWDTFAGIFGALGSDQIGSLLGLLTSSLGAGGSSYDLGQLTDLIDSLVPGVSDQFDPAQLTAMLGGLNGDGLSAATLSNLLGGQFSPAQLATVLDGTAGQALLGSVITQVMAQLATGGAGGLELPAPLSAGSLATLISTVTNLFSTITGGAGGGVLPVVCGLVPIPLLCP